MSGRYRGPASPERGEFSCSVSLSGRVALAFRNVFWSRAICEDFEGAQVGRASFRLLLWAPGGVPRPRPDAFGLLSRGGSFRRNVRAHPVLSCQKNPFGAARIEATLENRAEHFAFSAFRSVEAAFCLASASRV